MVDTNEFSHPETDKGRQKVLKPENTEGELERREVLRNIIKTTAYAAPLVVMLLVNANDAQAGVPISGIPGNN